MLGLLGVGKEGCELEGWIRGSEVDDAEVNKERREDVVRKDGKMGSARYRQGWWGQLVKSSGYCVNGEESLLEAVNR